MEHLYASQTRYLTPQQAASEYYQGVRYDPSYRIKLAIVIVEKLRLVAIYSPCVDGNHEYADYPQYIDEKCDDGTNDEIG